MPAERILLTGGAGFIGLELARRLSSTGAELTIVDDLSRGRLDGEAETLFSRGGVRFRRGDLRDTAALDGLDAPFDSIIHLAAVVGIQAAAREPLRVLDTNIRTTLAVTDFWRRNGGRLLFMSTSEVYGALMGAAEIPVPTPEDVPVGLRDTSIPRLSYAASKLVGEMLVRQVSSSTGLPSLVIRPHNVYGPRMGFDHVIPQMSLRALRRESPFRVFGPYETRAFCHVDDFCRAILLLLGARADGVYNIGTDRETRILDLAAAILSMSGHSAPILELPSQAGSPPRRCPDISRLRAVAGFEPAISLEEGLEGTFDWYRARTLENPGLLALDATP